MTETSNRTVRSSSTPRTPLGALPKLSPSARRALTVAGALAAGNAVALITQAWALASALAVVVTRGVHITSVGTEIRAQLFLLVGAIIARAVLGWALEAVSARAAAGAKEELRAALLDAAMRRGPEWISASGPAQLATLATKGLDALDAYFTKYLPALVTAAVVPLLVGANILVSDPLSALAVVLTVPLIPLFAWLVGRYTESRTSRAATATQRLSGHLLELVRALPVLTAFGRAATQREAVQRISDRHRRATLSTLRIAFLSALVLELFSSLSVALVAVGIGLRLVSGELDLATGLLVLVLVPECYLPLRAAGAAHHASEDGLEAVRRVHEVVDAAPRPAACGVRPEPGGVLRVTDLRVARRGGDAPAGLTFTARPGEIVHLDGFDGIGPSGSGKSTTFGVLLGFTTPTDGSVTYGGPSGEGVDIARFEPTEWRRRIAWVPQRPAFTGGTVADELALAIRDQLTSAADSPTGSDPDFRSVLEEAAAEHLLDRRIDELSTGERQRVAVARALLRLRRGADVLLLDEPTAHLDSCAAARVDAAVRRAAARGAAVVLASHRPGAHAADAAAPSCAGLATPAGSAGLAAQTAASRAPLPAPDRLSRSGQRGRLRDLITARTLAGVAIGALALLAAVALAAASAWLIARASQRPPVLMLSVAVVGVRTFALSRATLRYLERLVTHDAAFRLAGDLRRRLWDALVRLGPAHTSGLRRGDGAARLVDDADAIRDLVPRVVVPPLVAVLAGAGAVLLEATVLPAAGLLLAASLLTAGIAGPVVAVAVERRASSAVAEGRRRVSARVLGLLDASAELVAFGADGPQRARLAAEDARLAARSRRAAVGAGAATAVITLSLGAAVLGGAWLGGEAVAGGHLAPELAPLLALVPLAAAEAVAALPPAAQQWRALRAAQARVAPLLAAGSPAAGGDHAAVAGGEVVLHDVDVRWPSAAEAALRHVSLRIPRGTHVAVVGPSGAGKSTLVSVLLGFLKPERGVAWLADRVTWCPQEPQLVSTTIRENLRMASPGATDVQFAEALRLAGLDGWEERLDQQVGSTGMALSGGEAQRLALARALLVDNADLVLLDEPTAHLDVSTSDELLAGLRHALHDRTVVHITHRAAEAAHADIVLRVEGQTVRTELPGESASQRSGTALVAG